MDLFFFLAVYTKGVEKLEGFYKEIDSEFFNNFHGPTKLTKFLKKFE